MASAHSPQRVTFLLVDYKGGSAFRDCVELPHTVGLVTDLSPHLVRRALASLSAELRYREHLLARYNAKDLVELERRGEVDAPPSLIIVVDEFAALVQEVPEFVEGVVNVAQRGRSLGLHLILATQRPAGVIKDNLRANTNLRLALRMADESDSADVLGSSMAAYFDPALPGRAVSKSGPGRLTPFQTGYAGGWTSDTPPPPQIRIETLSYGLSQVWEPPVNESDFDHARADRGPTDIQRLVSTIGIAAKTAELPTPRVPWLPELCPVYDLARLPTARRDDQLVFGVADDPDHQAQPVVAFNPDKEGNLAVFGASGSGKSVFLRTIALAAGSTAVWAVRATSTASTSATAPCPCSSHCRTWAASCPAPTMSASPVCCCSCARRSTTGRCATPRPARQPSRTTVAWPVPRTSRGSSCSWTA